jgi:hypothetical protein
MPVDALDGPGSSCVGKPADVTVAELAQQIARDDLLTERACLCLPVLTGQAEARNAWSR